MLQPPDLLPKFQRALQLALRATKVTDLDSSREILITWLIARRGHLDEGGRFLSPGELTDLIDEFSFNSNQAETSRAKQALRRRGLVRIVFDRDERIYLTDDGTRLIEQFQGAVADVLAGAIRRFSVEELNEVHSYLVGLLTETANLIAVDRSQT